MPKTNPPYGKQFREDAVELLRTSERPLKQVARELGVCATSLRRCASWRERREQARSRSGEAYEFGIISDGQMAGAPVEVTLPGLGD